MKPQKIVLIRGIHPNELDLSGEIATKLRKQGHRVKIVSVPFRETMHGHSRFGKRKRPITDFHGEAFVKKIGFSHPNWHVIGVHSSPAEDMPNVILLREGHGETLGRHQYDVQIGHFYLGNTTSSTPDYYPVVPHKGKLMVGERFRGAIEIPAVYEDKPSMPLNESKFHFPQQPEEHLKRTITGYGRRAIESETFKLNPKEALVAAAVDKINPQIQLSARMRDYLLRKSHHDIELTNYWLSQLQRALGREAFTGHIKAVRYAERFLRKRR